VETALGINWIGLMAFKDENFELIGSTPAESRSNWRHKSVSIHKSFTNGIDKSTGLINV
jgi:hypothetical protein